MQRSSSRIFATILAWPAILVLAASLGAAESKQSNLGHDGLAVSGYDPVSYFQEGGPKKGDPSLAVEADGAAYCFVSAENQAAFKADPAKYEPAFGGWCAWAMLDGDTVEVDPLRFRIFDGHLLLFYDGFWGNTLEKWDKKAKAENEAELYATALRNWRRIASKN